MSESTELIIDSSVIAWHRDGWGWKVWLDDVSNLKFAYVEPDENGEPKVHPGKQFTDGISPLIAKRLCEAIKLVASQDEFSDFND